MSECRKQQLAASKTYTLTIPPFLWIKNRTMFQISACPLFPNLFAIIIIIYLTRKDSGLSRNGPQAWLPFHSYSRTCCVCLGEIRHGDNKTSNNSKIYMPNGTRLVLMATEKCFEGSRRKNSFVGRFTEERSRPSGNIPCFSTQENSECNKATLIGDR